MPRYYEIEFAFRNAIVFEPNGRRTVTTRDFVRELRVLNWHFSLKEANNWIETSVSTFRDISTEEGENRVFMLFNPN